MYFITTKRMLEVCFFQHTPTFIIEPENEKENEQGFHGLSGSDCDDGGNVGFGICAGTYW